MGRQGGIGRFIGSCRQLVGYVDDGKVLWRQHGRLDGKRWRKQASLENSRVAARYFGAASAVAGDLWRKLPKEMRRLADSGAFNRLVGKCRDLIDWDGQVWGLDELAGMDLALDSSGPLVVSGSVSGGWRLSGVRELMQGIDLAVGPGVGKPSEKYLMAHRFVNDGIVRESVDWGPMGDCRKWRSKHKDVRKYQQKPEFKFVTREIHTKRRVRSSGRWEKVAPKPLPPGIPYPYVGSAERRVRVWVYASEVAETVWKEDVKRYDLVWPRPWRMQGFVTDWLVGGRIADAKAGVATWEKAYAVDGKVELQPRCPGEDRPDVWGSGIFVVFTAVEVSEKRGRHWVRLPWCSRMQVHSVVDNWDLPPSGPEYVTAGEWLAGGVLRAEPARRIVGMDMDWAGAWDFWSRWDGWDGRILWDDLGLSEVCGKVLGYDGGELVAAWPLRMAVFGRDGPS